MFDLDQTDRLLTTTRAVRKRLDLDRPVPREVVLECLRIATHAPSGANMQPWRWLVVEDPDVRKRLAEVYRAGYEPYLALQRAAVEARGNQPADLRGLASSDHLAEHLHEVPVLVVPCYLGRLSSSPSTAEAAGVFGSVVPAVWSFMLALRSRGLGTAYTTLHLEREQEAAEALGIPDTVTQLCLLPVAYTTGTDFKPAPRRPVEEVTYFNGWRQR